MIPLDPFEVVCLQAKLIVSNRVCYLNKLHFYLDTGAQPLYLVRFLLCAGSGCRPRPWDGRRQGPMDTSTKQSACSS